jgi:tetratricopeptide (TPR) repeat protein
MMRRRGTFLLTGVLITACAHRANAPEGGSDKATIKVGPEAFNEGGGPGLAAWIAYGARRVALYEKRLGTVRNRSADDFALELGARSALADFWAQQRANADKPSVYLDLLVDLRSAGHLDEYVLVHLSRPGWTVPGDALAEIDLAGFLSWSQTRLANHQPITAVAVVPVDGPLTPPVPGGSLPDAASLSPKVVPCASSAARIDAALAAWTKEEAALDGAPLGAFSSAEFARAVDWARGQPQFRTRGVTWVSPAAGDLHFLRGFCAVDRHDYAAATRALTESIRLDPLSPGSRLELAHVMVRDRRFDDADRQIDGVLATNQDRCVLGRAYRQRGYILVERGRLEEAYAAYQKSLDHEPGSQLALREMVFIAGEIQRQGGPAARAFKPYQPPATPNQVVTECEDRR